MIWNCQERSPNVASLSRTFLTCDQAYFSLDVVRKGTPIQFLYESSARSPEPGLFSDWPKNNRALGSSLRLVTELQIILLVNRLTSDEIMAAEKDLNTSNV